MGKSRSTFQPTPEASASLVLARTKRRDHSSRRPVLLIARYSRCGVEEQCGDRPSGVLRLGAGVSDGGAGSLVRPRETNVGLSSPSETARCPRASTSGAAALVISERAAQRSTRSPMVTVRSSGSPKYPAGLAALWAIVRNSFLRQLLMPGPSVGTIVICDRNAQSRNQEWFVRWPSQPLLAVCSSVTLEGPEVARPWGDPTALAFIELAHELHAGGASIALANTTRSSARR